MGTSVGRWDGDTLVITTAGFNGRTWLDTAQHPHSDALKLTIRMTRPDFDHLNWDVTIEDSKSLPEADQEHADVRADGEGHGALRVFVRGEQSLRRRQVCRGRCPKVATVDPPTLTSLTYLFQRARTDLRAVDVPSGVDSDALGRARSCRLLDRIGNEVEDFAVA